MNLLVVDDHEVVRKGLALTLGYRIEDITIVEAATLNEALVKLKHKKIEYILLDINMKGENGLDLILRCEAEGIKAHFIVLTAFSRREDFVRAKELGVAGYILKDSSIEDIAYGIQTVKKGKKFFDARFMQKQEVGQREKIKSILTEREFEILKETGHGNTNSQIADNLFITENTVKKHISSILGKLRLKNRIEAALLANRLWRRKDD